MYELIHSRLRFSQAASADCLPRKMAMIKTLLSGLVMVGLAACETFPYPGYPGSSAGSQSTQSSPAENHADTNPPKNEESPPVMGGNGAADASTPDSTELKPAQHSAASGSDYTPLGADAVEGEQGVSAGQPLQTKPSKSSPVEQQIEPVETALVIPAKPSPAPAAQADLSRVRSLLVKARRHMAISQYFDDSRNNAARLYQEVLAMDPENAEARSGIKRIGAIYAKAATAMFERNDLEIAFQITERGLEIDPDNGELLDLIRRIRASY